MGQSLARYIDHTLLKPDAGEQDVLRIAQEAVTHSFASVCVNPVWVPTVAKALEGSPVKTCSVVGFPLGATPTEVKVFEAQRAIQSGAQEIDMVVNIADAKSGNFDALVSDIAPVAKATHIGGALLKVIIESGLLTDDQVVSACRASIAADADFVKTSTGFNGSGATVHHVRLMRETVGPDVGVKASGGVRSAEDAKAMIAAGASRLGASSGVAIVSGEVGTSSY